MRPPSAPLLAAVVAAVALPAAASAQLSLPVPPLPVSTPDPGQVVDDVTGALPDPVTGVVDTVTGTVGGIVDTATGATGGVTDTVGQTVDGVLDGTVGELPIGTIDDLLGAAGLNGLNGAPGAPGVTVLPDGTVLVDSRAPVTKVTVLNRNRTVGRNGKLRLRISSDEPSVVALVGTIRPGRAWKLHGKAAKRHSRKAVKIPKVVLAYRKAGSLVLTIQFSGRTQRNIRQSYNSAVKLNVVAVDVARNQVTRKLNRVVKH